MQSSIFLSNRLEVLADALSDRLFDSHSKPFQKRMVIVPGDKLRTYLLHRFARDPKMRVAAGIHICSLSQGVNELIKVSQQSNARIASRLDLSLQIEYLIVQMIENPDKWTKEIFQDMDPLFVYLKVNNCNTASRRIASLSERLSKLFSCYGIYGGSLLREWLEKKGWQQTLWKILYESSNSTWTYPVKALQHPLKSDFKVHVFGFPFLPKPYLDFIKDQGVFYILSPCQEFWSDLCTEKERVFLQRGLKKQGTPERQRRELDAYLKDQNSFLANMGKLGRRYLDFLDDDALVSEEKYTEPMKDSLLHKVQHDLLMLKCPSDDEQKGAIPVSDTSIQLHACPSKLREIEILKDTLLGIIQKEQSTKEPILPKDILVLAPDIQEYAPYIQMVFGQNDNVDASIFDLEICSQSPFAQAFKHLLDLPFHRFDLDAVLKLFNYPQFLKKFGLDEEEVSLIRNWLRKVNVYWGIDASQRNALLSADYEGEKMLEDNNVGTWEHAWNVLLKGLTTVPAVQDLNGISSVPGIELNDASVLGKLMHIVTSLSIDLRPLIEKGSLSLPTWIRYFKNLAESYFSLAEEDLSVLEEFDLISDQFKQATENVFPFSSMKRVLDHVLKKKQGSIQASFLNTVKFCSLTAGSALPAQVVCLLGMQDGAYPRPDQRDSLCEISFNKENHRPSRAEEDRYLFLELLLSARKYLILSFQRICPKDNQAQAPSILVQEFLSYLDKNDSSGISKKILKEHPLLPFDRRYFTSESPLRSYSNMHFLAAKAHFSNDERHSEPFIEELYRPIGFVNRTKEQDIVIDIKSLKGLSKNPIRFYFNKCLGMYFESDHQEEAKKQEFVISNLNKSILCSQSLKYPLETVLEAAYQNGGLPLGALRDVACRRIQKETEELHANLEMLNVRPSDIFSLELKTTCKDPFLSSNGTWILPSLKVPLDRGRTAHIIGKLEGLSAHGMLAYKNNNFEDLLEIWPLILVMLSLPNFEKKSSPQILLTKCGKSKQCRADKPLDELRSYIDYYEQCLDYASPLIPKWGKALLKGSPEELEKEIGRPLEMLTYVDPYLEWLFLRSGRPSGEIVFENWSTYLREKFSGMIRFEES
ncbi:MAG TPA: exodeoxyribonuclease V subunit gamma [Rhabdochlamydiaceae bacterium]|nr:exodeoxyribonuclease V subunit gamma [Rhabdochlamydiaceae bacterium]